MQDRLYSFGNHLTAVSNRPSVAYLEKSEHPMLEWEVKVMNIHFSAGHCVLYIMNGRPLFQITGRRNDRGYIWILERCLSTGCR